MKIKKTQNIQILLILFLSVLFISAGELKIYEQQGSLIVFDHVKPKALLSKTLEQELDQDQQDKLKDLMLDDYKKARDVFEESLAEVALTHPDVKKFVKKYLERLYTLINIHAEINYEAYKAQNKTVDSFHKRDLWITLEENRLIMESIGCLNEDKKTLMGTGYRGANPLSLRKAFREGNLREKIYQYYRSGRYLEPVLENKELLKKINDQLESRGESWRVRREWLPLNKAPYALGLYCKVKARRERTDQEISDWKRDNLHVKISEAETQIRIPLSEREKRFMRTIKRKEDPRIPWIPGAAWFLPFSLKECQDLALDDDKKEYAKIVEEHFLKQYSSVSSTADRMLTSAIFLDFKEEKDLYQARLTSLWMVECKDHSVHEILFSSKSFHLPFSFKVDFYKDIYPLDPDFENKLRKAQKEKGYELPDYYLGQEYSEIRGKKE